MTDFDAACSFATLFGHFVKQRLVVSLVGAGVFGGELCHHGGTSCVIVKINLAVTECEVSHGAIVEHLRLARFGQHEKFMGVFTTNRAGIGTHWNGLEAHAFISAQVADEVAVIRMQRIFLSQIKVIAVFHIEFAAPHDAKARTGLVAELPLDLVKCQRQVFVRCDMGAEDVSDQFFSGRCIEHLATAAVFDPQHLVAVSVVASAFAPEVRRLDRWHQHGVVASFRLLFMHDIFNFLENFIAQRQPAINASACLLDHACLQHVAVRDDLRLAWGLFENGQEIAAHTHDIRGLW